MGKPSGYGEYFWFDGSSYKGEFKDALRSGFGIYCDTNGNRHEGHF